jgi:hypothetical protein
MFQVTAIREGLEEPQRVLAGSAVVAVGQNRVGTLQFQSQFDLRIVDDDFAALRMRNSEPTCSGIAFSLPATASGSA